MTSSTSQNTQSPSSLPSSLVPVSSPCLLHFAIPLISALLTFLTPCCRHHVALYGFWMTPVILAGCDKGREGGKVMMSHTFTHTPSLLLHYFFRRCCCTSESFVSFLMLDVNKRLTECLSPTSCKNALTIKIGRNHSPQQRVAKLFFPCSYASLTS